MLHEERHADITGLVIDRKRNLIVVCLLIFLVATIASGGRTYSASVVREPTVTRHALVNGITVVVNEDHSSPIAAASVFVRAGARSESRANAGIRRFVQEMLLHGTQNLTRDQILDAVESHGASLDVAVGDDYVELYATGSGEDLGSMIPLIGRILTEPAFRPEDIESVRRELLAIGQRRVDTFLSRASDVVRTQMYQDSEGRPVTFGLPREGLPESILQITRNDLVGFFRAHYVGPNIVIAVSGDVTRDVIVEKIRNAFARIPGKEPSRGVAPLWAPPSTPRLSVMESPSNQAWVIIAFSAPGVSAEDYPALTVLTTLMGKGMKSRLFEELRDKTSTAYNVGAVLTARSQNSDLLTYAEVDPMSVEDTKRLILAQFENLRNHPPSPAELDRARKKTIGEFILNHQRNRQRSWHLGLFEAMGLGYPYDAQYPDHVRRVSAENITSTANELKQFVIVLAMPAAAPSDSSEMPPGPQSQSRRLQRFWSAVHAVLSLP